MLINTEHYITIHVRCSVEINLVGAEHVIYSAQSTAYCVACIYCITEYNKPYVHYMFYEVVPQFNILFWLPLKCVYITETIFCLHTNKLLGDIFFNDRWTVWDTYHVTSILGILICHIVTGLDIKDNMNTVSLIWHVNYVNRHIRSYKFQMVWKNLDTQWLATFLK